MLICVFISKKQFSMTFQLVEELPNIYGIEKNGKTKVWSGRIYSNGVIAKAEIEYGQIDGKKQMTVREYNVGKNIGKKNETSPLEQCIAETKKKWQDKIDKESYSLDQSGEVEIENPKVFPMLAHIYDPSNTKHKKNNIEFPCYVQPKLDGLRCIMYIQDGEVVAQSRTGGYFLTMEHICNQLKPLFLKTNGLILDGELYTNEIPFQELAGLIKKKKINELTEEERTKINYIKYHIYDVVNDKPFVERYAYIYRTIPKLNPNSYLEVVSTQLINSVDEFKELFSEYIGDGYEGIMLRNINGKYVQNYRSYDLQKYKDFDEAEFPIVGFEEGKGRDKGTVVWICKNSEGLPFNARPMGTLAYRKECFENAHLFMNKQLTVLYQGVSEYNIPRFPRGKAIRDGY